MRANDIRLLERLGVQPALVKVLVAINDDNAALRQNQMKLAEAYLQAVNKIEWLQAVMEKLGQSAVGRDGKPLLTPKLTTAAQERARAMNVDVGSEPADEH